MTRRTRKPKGALVAWWSSAERDLMFAWDKQAADGSLLNTALCAEHHMKLTDTWAPSLVDELERRGYDLTTLRFSIERKAEVTK